MAKGKGPAEPTFAVGQAEDLAPNQRRKKTKADEARDDLRAVVALPEGRRVLRRLLEKTAPFASSFDSDPAVMAFREGHRNVGLILISMLAEMDGQALAALLVEVQGTGQSS
jgi:hypothetical protein